MMRNRADVLEYVAGVLAALARDLGYEGGIGAETRLFADLGYESLDVVVLGTAIQDHFQRPMAFAELLADLGQRDIRDLTLGELVDFVHGELQRTTT